MFIIVKVVEGNAFAAGDGSANRINIELYTDVKSPETENEVEQVLKRHNIYYTKNEVWIASEKMYEVLYEMEV